MPKSSDKFLLFFILGIVVILAITFIIIFRTPEPTYTEDDNPEGVVFNYILALRKADYEKALGYLSPSLEEHPRSAKKFSQLVNENPYVFGNLSDDFIIKVEQTQLTEDQATVEVTQTHFYSSGLFYRREYTTDFEMRLEFENNEWKIIYGSKYWFYCWGDPTVSCYGKPQ